VAVAYLQHRVALAVRAELGNNAPALLARRLGAPWREDYFRRKLNGQIPLHLTELMELALELGPSILPFGVQRATLLPRPKSE
jgi:hypothetical protein